LAPRAYSGPLNPARGRSCARKALRNHLEKWWVGRPWLPGSQCDHLYLSAAYRLPTEFAVLKHDFESAHLLWAVPITEAEKCWRHEHGQEAFEQLMEDRELIPYDPSRPPLVQP
jgi:Suppressor of fused protein (SUFU)